MNDVIPAAFARAFDDRVRERDVEHFLIEELQADPVLLRFFFDRVAHAFQPPLGVAPVIGKARRRDGRETDVRVAYPDGTDDPPSLLIENKVGDGFQEGQPESYATEVARLRALRGPLAAAAILLAPRTNVAVARHPCFNGYITLEEVADHLRSRLGHLGLAGELRTRLAVRIELLDTLCVKRTASRWIATPVAAVADFAALYESLAREVVADLRVRPTTAGSNARTRFFDGFLLQKGFFPVTVQLKHEFGDGIGVKYANLEFDGAAGRLKAFLAAGDLFPPDGSVFPTSGGRSLMIRTRTPAVVRDPAWFVAHRDEVTAGLQAVRQLGAWLVTNASRVRNLLSG
jgi:hypothetical protein